MASQSASSSSSKNNNVGASSKKSLLSETWASFGTETRRVRKRSDKSLHDVVKQKLYDNGEQRGLTFLEMNGIVDDKTGLTMAQRVERDVRQADTVKGSVKWGKNYWRSLRSTYQDHSRASRQLPTPCMPSQGLFAALEAHNHPLRPCSRALLDWFITAGTDVSEADVCALCRLLTDISWSSSETKLLLALDVVDFLQKAKVKERFPTVVKAMKSDFDELLLAVHECMDMCVIACAKILGPLVMHGFCLWCFTDAACCYGILRSTLGTISRPLAWILRKKPCELCGNWAVRPAPSER